MSDETKVIPTTKLPRGALYLLESILQDPRPCDSPIKVAKWARLYAFVRKSNDRTLVVNGAKYDLEKARNQIILAAGEVTDATGKRKLEESLLALEAAAEVWRNEEIDLTLSTKYIDTAKDAVRYRIKNQDLAKGLGYPINEHGLALIDVLNLDDAE